MKYLNKAFRIMLLFSLIMLKYSCTPGDTPYGSWTIINNNSEKTKPVWLDFYWDGDTLGRKYYGKSAMFIPVKIDGMPHTYTFQFDLGSDLTMVFEKNVNTLFALNPDLKNKIERLNSPLLFWNNQKDFQGLVLDFNGIKALTQNCYLKRDYGYELTTNDMNDSIPIYLGTIGADLFQDKVLIIDYPKQKFAICDSVPSTFNIKMVDIELDDSGRAILPMKIRNKIYRIMFDNGSSIFPLITMDKNIDNFSTEMDNDTIPISSWGEIHNVTGKLIRDTFELAGQTFSNVEIYANHTGLGIDPNTDGMAGNALFWDKTIIIDFKNKKFGIVLNHDQFKIHY